MECVGILNAELENYLKRLVKKPCVVVLNKTDLVEKQVILFLIEILKIFLIPRLIKFSTNEVDFSELIKNKIGFKKIEFLPILCYPKE